MVSSRGHASLAECPRCFPIWRMCRIRAVAGDHRLGNQLGHRRLIGSVTKKSRILRHLRARGLTGEQGVLIPAANVKHLMRVNDVWRRRSRPIPDFPRGDCRSGHRLLTVCRPVKRIQRQLAGGQRELQGCGWLVELAEISMLFMQPPGNNRGEEKKGINDFFSGAPVVDHPARIQTPWSHFSQDEFRLRQTVTIMTLIV